MSQTTLVTHCISQNMTMETALGQQSTTKWFLVFDQMAAACIDTPGLGLRNNLLPPPAVLLHLPCWQHQNEYWSTVAKWPLRI